FIETSVKEDELGEEGKRCLNVSGVLRILGVSRSGYNAFKKRLPSDMAKRKSAIKEDIKRIYDESYQNYGAPKITQILNGSRENISEKTVGKLYERNGDKSSIY
ncbi:MAG: IS3 family transposase, partial [Filifactoraceae bacterium]